jgi:hypothetical protein
MNRDDRSEHAVYTDIANYVVSPCSAFRIKTLIKVRAPRHNPAENALIATMRGDPNVPCLNSLAAMRHYARQRWPHDAAVQSLMPGLWRRYRRRQWDNSEA